jgi:phage shock protein PspC (stress-responsive transcriptional regulator)
LAAGIGEVFNVVPSTVMFCWVAVVLYSMVIVPLALRMPLRAAALTVAEAYKA